MAARVCCEFSAEGMVVWDMNAEHEKPKHGVIFRRIGHADDAEAFARELPNRKTVKLKSNGGIDVCHVCNGRGPDGAYPAMLTLATAG